MTLDNRIQAIVDYSKLSIPQFAKKVGFKTPQTVREILKGNTKTLSFEAKSKILGTYPELNEDWLLTGNGEMLRTNHPDMITMDGGRKNVGKVGGNVDYREGTFYETCPQDATHISNLEKEVARLNCEVTHRNDIIAEKDKRIASLESQLADKERIIRLMEGKQ